MQQLATQATNASTKHTCESEERAFGRRVAGCPRCDELKNGAPARSGWQAGYFSRKARDEAALSKAIREHNCQTARCGVVCTAFQW